MQNISKVFLVLDLSKLFYHKGLQIDPFVQISFFAAFRSLDVYFVIIISQNLVGTFVWVLRLC